MRRLLAFVLLVTTLASIRAAEVELVRVWPGWRDEASFLRISEYFGGKENTGDQIMLRTHAEARAGFYFLTRVKNSSGALSGAKFALHLIAPDSPEPKLYTFPADLAAGSTVFQIGLTSTDWPGPKVHPVAWMLELVTADGRVLAAQKSFLWEKPAK